MKRISLWIAVFVVTLVVGIGLTLVWLFQPGQTLDAHPPITLRKTDCSVEYDARKNPPRADEWNKVLARFNEMPLDALPSCVETSYRIIWIPSFHAPVSIRIWSAGGQQFMSVKHLDGKGGYGMGNLGKSLDTVVSDEQWLEVERRLRTAGFWDLPSVDTDLPPEDGADWVIEGWQDHQFHDVHRRAPSTEVRECFDYLFGAAGIRNELEGY